METGQAFTGRSGRAGSWRRHGVGGAERADVLVAGRAGPDAPHGLRPVVRPAPAITDAGFGGEVVVLADADATRRRADPSVDPAAAAAAAADATRPRRRG
ncbi:hypothetical protein ACQPYK_34725 [Streptosporangium sp. CA-135522]|uniref:hypothetical protein n=1 Tax=Streptosporangium sp. CA-135522 TaxID=3240072 RepID=UPI003D8BE83B